MLQQWATSNSARKPSVSKVETPEQRENRLLTKYESALNAPSHTAKTTLTEIVQNLSESRTQRLGKRPRPPTPLWERRLRYVVYRNLADVYVRLNDHDHALENYSQALDDDNTDFLTWLKTARAAIQTGRLHVARRAYEVALSMRPRHWLAQSDYQAVLCAIFDADEDVIKPNIEKLSPQISLCLSNRRRQINAYKEKSKPTFPERIVLSELSWACLVDALISCLETRVSFSASHETHDISHPVVFDVDEELCPGSSNYANNNDTVVIVPSSPDEREVIDLVSTSKSDEGLERQNDVASPANDEDRRDANIASRSFKNDKSTKSIIENQNQKQQDDASVVNAGNHGIQSTKALANVGLSQPTKVEDESQPGKDVQSGQPKKPELRRSNRGRIHTENQDEERRLTRTATGAKDSTQMDIELIRTLLNLSNNSFGEEEDCETRNESRSCSTKQKCSRNSTVAFNSKQVQRTCAWNAIIDERAEADQVHNFVDLFPEKNSGPADLMLRTLNKLAEIQVAQYSSSLALLWSAIRKRLQLHMPGSISTTALVIEAMILSGKKAGKAKERRFKEASRLLSHVAVDFDIEKEPDFLKLRLTWVRANLNECCGKMQTAFEKANEALVLLENLENGEGGDSLPEAAGPELSGYSFNTLRNVINERISRLKRAGDLEKAETEFSKVAQGDKQAAIRTVKILAPSVNASIRALDFDKWDENDLATEFSTTLEHRKWEERLDAEIELEPRLKVFGEACAKAADLVGELLCFSVRLRMAVHFYAAQLRDEFNENEKLQTNSGSCEVRLADLLVLIRKYALVTKKIANPSSSDIWNLEEVVCGWSMESATSIAEITLISLTKLLTTKIPILKFSAPISELGASQKNKRLGFTRCMLAFVRCFLVNQYCRISYDKYSQDPESQQMRSLTTKRLFATSFCLRALVDRGCCREEGTSGALMKLYSQYLAERLRQLALTSRSKVSNLPESQPRSSPTNSSDNTQDVFDRDGNKSCEKEKEAFHDDAHSERMAMLKAHKEGVNLGNVGGKEKNDEEHAAQNVEKEKIEAEGKEDDFKNEKNKKQERTADISELRAEDGENGCCIHAEEHQIGTKRKQGEEKRTKKDGNEEADGGDDDDTLISQIDSSYKWRNVTVIRRELAQCYQCLYQIPDLELTSFYTHGGPADLWLEEGCRVSRHIGLQFTSGDPMNIVPVIDAEACCSVYFFYRKKIFEAIGQRRRDGGRGKKLREVLSRLAESLPETPPSNVHLLPFKTLNEIVMDVISSDGDISRGAAENVTRLEEEWNRGLTSKTDISVDKRTKNVQLSILYFEVFTLHALSTMGTHDVEYKKQKSAERRKSPKEVAERLISAYSDCLVALRSRPWSIGAWILLGRIFVETADLALDERELSLSSFGLYRPGDLSTFDEKISSINAIFGRAEASFAFAESLLCHPWAQKATINLIPINSALVLGQAFQVECEWDGFGDDCDLFGLFGLTNATTCRPRLIGEYHPNAATEKDDCQRLAAIRFGCSALSILRLRELRYFHMHWTQSTLETRFLTHPRNRYPNEITRLASAALTQLLEARKLCGIDQDQPSGLKNVQVSDSNQTNAENGTLSFGHTPEIARSGKAENSNQKKFLWYYIFLEAKLMRKEGRPAKDYLPVFHRAMEENKILRESTRQPLDIEPIYKLHAARMKILRAITDSINEAATLSLLEKYRFSPQGRPILVDEGNRKHDEDWIIERKIAIAEDIILAMQFCANPKSEMMYSEFFFKSTFCKSVLLVEVLKDTKTALLELDKLFGTESALRALDQGPDGVYRGYFYRMWNYHYTDTGIEPAIESERKLVRWRGKMLGLYGNLLKNVGEWRLLAAIISRLKRRNSEDLPVDGALLDDLIEAYAVTSRSSILISMEKSIVTDPSAFEFSYRRTWDIYAESLRISQGMKRVGICLSRGELNETGGERLLKSGRPKCLAAIHTALRLEHIRWKSAVEDTAIDMNSMRALPSSGSLFSLPILTRQCYLETLQESASKWPLEEKITKLLLRRITELSSVEVGGHPG
ncbi:unnamed protein product [Agarophyton chilense]|eukprot:gb/GEZJ01002343.1/.p1 GENE.gb/GEZJ01002343.1/~~gb/GEZJ01002343.1/.p1  ORF type:complete len:2036 (-),score=282.43 gb/GEZJ01002343.1/:1134-7241(-)